MYKLLAIDLDETLLNSHHEIDSGNKEAIKEAKANGVKVVPCSGRGPGFLGTLYDDLDLNKEGEYSILCNGAIILEHKTNKVISCFPLTYEKAEELYTIGRNEGLCIQVFTPENVHVFHPNDEERERIKNFGNNIIFHDDDANFEILKNKTIIKLLFEKANSLEYLQALADKLEPITKDHVTVSFSSNRYLELNALGIHKGRGLKELANYLQIDISETIGVGDNYNDLGLIEDAGLGVAVQNAIQPIKDISDVVTKATNNENAIAEVINTYILKKENYYVK